MSADPASAAAPASSPPQEDADEAAVLEKFARLKKRVRIQTWAIAGLGAVLLLVLPFAQPVYLYYAMEPDKKVLQMVALDMPNMTNRAVLSWATTSITEIMTVGFGDIDVKLPKQKWRFTGAGWKAYAKAFVIDKIGETFRQNQLVLTTVPSNTPVVVAQGVNQDQVYQWIVQMPVIMTYATNDNITKQQRGVVTLAIVRVPAEQSSAGIAIEKWSME